MPQVFEQFPSYQKAGALLGLAPNTQNALRAIDPVLLEAAAKDSVPDGRSLAFDHEGVDVTTMPNHGGQIENKPQHGVWAAGVRAKRCDAGRWQGGAN